MVSLFGRKKDYEPAIRIEYLHFEHAIMISDFTEEEIVDIQKWVSKCDEKKYKNRDNYGIWTRRGTYDEWYIFFNNTIDAMEFKLVWG